MSISQCSRWLAAPIASVLMAWTGQTGALPESAFQEAADDSFLAVLRSHGIDPTRESLREFLQSLVPDEGERLRQLEACRSLVEQLGDDNYQVRDRADRALARMPQLSARELESAARSSVPEVAYRARRLLEYVNSGERKQFLTRITDAVCRAVRSQKIDGLCASLLQVIPLFDDPFLQTSLRSALVATVRETDVDLLRSAMISESTQVRTACVEGLAALLREAAADDLQRLGNDPQPEVQFAAARAMANLGLRDAFSVFVRLLDSSDVELRVRSDHALRALTGKSFDFVAYASPDERAPAVERWVEWITDHGQTADLSFPLKDSIVLLGRTLISDYQANRVIEVDRQGRKIWEVAIAQPWGVGGISNGHRRITSYSGNFLAEYDEQGKEVWRKEGLAQPMGIDCLENGNTLVACSGQNKVVELRPGGEVAWEAAIAGRPVDVQRLENGRTLVALVESNRVVELDTQGQVVWELPNAISPISVQRLSNGHTLVASNMGAARIYDRDGKVSEEIGGEGITVARRHPDGDMLLGSRKAVRQVGEDGTVRWIVDDLAYCYGAVPY